ncbi:MAG: hypothetical protein A4C66_04525 [Nitrospira sp. HN-bin3]|nr:MAG: hypothetical protein A4C66_04525 [Nitrospira sp. HN-bin3]
MPNINMIRAVVLVASGLLTGCATIANGKHQDLTVTSQPEALCVTINGEPYGATPVVAPLPRKQTYVVQVRKDNYLPYEMTVVPVMNSMIWGNLFFGGLIGMAIDDGTGAAYEHSPSRVHAYFPVPVGQAMPNKSEDCPVSVAILEARQKAAEKAAEQAAERALFVKSGYTPYQQSMGH